MALPATTVIEVRSTGSDSNGGGFNSSRGGTDYSQQDAAQATGTASVSGTTLTATTGIFTSQMVGNYVTDGTSWREITAFTSSTVVTIDSTVAWTGASINVGGALATATKAINTVMVGSNLVWLKNGIGSIASTLTPPSGTGSALSVVRGYGSSRGDGTQCTVQASAAIAIFTMSNSDVLCWDIDADGNSTGSRCFDGGSGTRPQARNCKARRFTDIGFNVVDCDGCRATGGGSSGTAAVNNGYFKNGTIDANACPGYRFTFAGGPGIENSQVVGNTGASTDGIISAGASCGPILGNTISDNGRDGIRFDASNGARGTTVLNNLITNNGACGVRSASDVVTAAVTDYNFFGGGASANTSGARSNWPTGAHDVTLTGDPYTNKAAGDYSLNATAGAGGAVRAAGFPGAFLGGATTGYRDGGAVQHQDSGGTTPANPLSLILNAPSSY